MLGEPKIYLQEKTKIKLMKDGVNAHMLLIAETAASTLLQTYFTSSSIQYSCEPRSGLCQGIYLSFDFLYIMIGAEPLYQVRSTSTTYQPIIPMLDLTIHQFLEPSSPHHSVAGNLILRKVMTSCSLYTSHPPVSMFGKRPHTPQDAHPRCAKRVTPKSQSLKPITSRNGQAYIDMK